VAQKSIVIFTDFSKEVFDKGMLSVAAVHLTSIKAPLSSLHMIKIF
jgi:hypothetical protein